MTSPSSKMRVLIATTEGALDVVFLDREPEEIAESFVVLASDPYNTWAPLSGVYNSFVSRKTGLIGRLYDHESFRLTISGRIDKGFSWQLGILIAHALKAAERLAEGTETGETVIFATGQIGWGALEVNKVGSVELKLMKAFERLQQERAAGRRVICIWPQDNHLDAAPRIESLTALGIEIVEAESAANAFAALGLPQPVFERVMAAKADQPNWQGSPFRGLEAFDAEHRAVFFGRGQAREEALEILRRAATRDCAFLLIYGNSGSGKSSLARAGLMGDIAVFASEAEVWRSAVVVLGRSEQGPIAVLATVLAATIPELGLTPDELAAQLREEYTSVIALIRVKLGQGTAVGRQKLVLLVDQLEDLLLWARERATEAATEEQRRFIDVVAALARSGSVWILATLRSDLLPLIEEEDSGALTRLASNERRYALRAPSRAELRDIVQSPAEMAGLKLEGKTASGLSLSDVLVDAVATNPDSLPLLQFALERLYENEGRSGKISLEAYERMGAIEGAIGRHAEATIDQLDKTVGTEQAVQDVILALARFDHEGGKVVARTARLDVDMASTDRLRVIDALVSARLLVKTMAKDNAGEEAAMVRVAHEALLTHWPRAQRLLEERRNTLELRERIESEAKAWTARDEDASYLLQPGSALTAATQLVEEGRIGLSGRARRFVVIAKDVAEKRSNAELSRLRAQAIAERRRSQIAVAAAIALFGLAAIASWLYLGIGRIETSQKVIQNDKYIAVVSGFLDLKQDRIEIDGMLIPKEIFDFLSGDRRQKTPDASKSIGLLGTHFTIKGSLGNPVLSYDPISALPPGYLRYVWTHMNK